MEIAFELARVTIATLSRRCTNFIINSASKSNRFRRTVIATGHVTNNVYVHLKYFKRLWLGKTKETVSSNEDNKIKLILNVKLLDESKALEVGADTLTEITVLLIMIFLVIVGVSIRHRKFLEHEHTKKLKEKEVDDRLDELSCKVEFIIKNMENHTLISNLQEYVRRDLKMQKY